MQLLNFTSIFSKGALAKKFLILTILFSSIITIILTAIQLYFDFSNGLKDLHKNLDSVHKTHVKSLSSSLWHFNSSQLQSELLGILQSPFISYLEVKGNNNEYYKQGEIPLQEFIVQKTFPLIYSQNGESLALGHFTVVGSLEFLYKMMKDRFLVILIGQASRSLVVSIFIFIIFYLLVGKHLVRLAEYTEEMNIEKLEEELILNKKYLINEEQDEIDKLVSGINRMRKRLLNDIAQRKKIEKQLRQSQKMEALGTLAGGIAHDFNNILQGLMNTLSLIELDLGADSHLKNKINIGFSLTERARDLIKQILLYSKQEDGKFKKNSITKVLRDIEDLARSTRPVNVDIKTHIDTDLGFLKCDSIQIGQVLINLISNSIHAIGNEKYGTVEIRAIRRPLPINNSYQLKEGPYIEILVSDNGMGVPDTIQHRIFEPFFTTKTVNQGTGLGLSVVHGIIMAHNGAITVSSVPNEGTTFKVLLPAFTPEIKTNQYTGEENILILDDNIEYLEIINEDIKALGHKTTSFTSFEEALEYYQNDQENFSLIITDLILDKKNFTGIDFATQIRKFNKTIPIILLTGYDDNLSYEIETLNIKLLTKPHDNDELSRIIRKSIENQKRITT